MSPKGNSAFFNIFREPVRRKLIFLTLIFLLVCGILLSTGEYLRLQDNSFHKALDNEVARNSIGKILNKKLLVIENKIFRLSLAEDSRDLVVLKNDITENLTDIQKALKVLQDGGSFADDVPVNMNEIDEITEALKYSRPANSGYNIEVINLTPKVMDIEELADSLYKKVSHKLAEKKSEIWKLQDRNIRILTKQLETVFQRSFENVNKIFYDSNLELQNLKKNWETETGDLLLIRNFGIFFIVIVGLGLFLHTGRQIGAILQQRTAFAKKLEKSRQTLETILETTPVGIAILGKNREIRMVNQSILRLLGIDDQKDILGQHCFGFLCAQHATGCPLEEFHNGVFNREVTLKNQTGHPVPTIKSAIPIELAGEEVILEAFIDISERQKAELALHRESSKLGAMISGMEEGIVFVDRFEQVVKVNRYYRELVSPQADAIVDLDIFKLFPVNQHLTLKQVLKDFKTSVHTQPFVFQLDNYYGMDSIIRLQPIYLTEKYQEYDGLVINVVDVSELTEARRVAERSLRSKAHFLANMSHEIRTPLNGILGMAELLTGTCLSPEQKHFATTIQNSGEALLTILNDILDFSKIEAGKITLEEISFNLGKAVEEGVELLAKQAHEKNLELALQIPADTYIQVKGDPHRFRQILTNLISNAIKFTNEGEIIVRVTGRSLENRKRLFRFSVADTGIGIDPEQKNYLFKHFTQADNSTTRRFGGTGLGLSISRQLVELMGGSLHFESNLDEGSTFWFELPLSEEPNASPLELSIPNFPHIKALLVENHKPSRLIIEKQLATFGIDVQSIPFLDGIQDILNGTAPGDLFDMVLIDLNFPDLKELDVISAMAKNWPSDPARIVALAPLGSFNKNLHSQGKHIDAVLSKPIRCQELIDCLTTLLAPRPDNRKDIIAPVTQEGFKQPLNLRILVVEDNPVNQKVTIGMLNSLGCQTKLAENGQEAVEIFKLDDFDLVLMDCHMPVMDGYNATAEIRRFETRASGKMTPVIALTADTLTDGLEKARQANMDGFLSKPFSRADLRETLVQFSGK
ncbi:MAG: response regulator [Deltaproteobacteria bacterium]|nr:response regulator [Deltaproteobacteria bacterium]